LAANIIPITGTFGHLAAHPGEPLPAKISDIAFGLIDIPGLVELADTGRLLLTGADELSPIGKLAVELGESKAYNYPLLALGIGSMFLPSSHGEDIITKEKIYKTIPNVKDTIRTIKNIVNPKPYDPLALTLPEEPTVPEESEIPLILYNNDILRSYAKHLEEQVDSSLRINDNENRNEDEHINKVSSPLSNLYLGITLIIIVFIITLILIKA